MATSPGLEHYIFSKEQYFKQDTIIEKVTENTRQELLLRYNGLLMGYSEAICLALESGKHLQRNILNFEFSLPISSLLKELDKLIVHEVLTSGYLDKTGFEEKIAELELASSDISGLLDSRTAVHLYRMIRPQKHSDIIYKSEDYEDKDISNIFCHGFARDFISFACDNKDYFTGDHRAEDSFYAAIHEENNHAFWTLLPYVHERLRSDYQVGPDESIKLIVDWISKAAKTGRKGVDILPPCTTLFYDDATVRLGVDDRMPSHLKTRIVGGYVALYIFGEKTATRSR